MFAWSGFSAGRHEGTPLSRVARLGIVVDFASVACATIGTMSSPGRAKYGPNQYKQYIQSAEWRATRERYWTSKLPSNCFVCERPRVPGMHLHHRTYKNLGAERLMDLVPVCPECHSFIHQLSREPFWKSHGGLWAATKEARRRAHPTRRRGAGKMQRGPESEALERAASSIHSEPRSAGSRSEQLKKRGRAR